MPLPATWHSVSDVGTTGGKRSGIAPRPHAKVGGLFRRGQFEQRQARSFHVRTIRCADIRGIPETIAAASLTRQTYDHRAGQCQIPPCPATGALTGEISQGTHAPVPPTVQSAVGAYRAGLETCSPGGNAQPILPHVGRFACRRRRSLRSLAETQRCVATVMRH